MKILFVGARRVGHYILRSILECNNPDYEVVKVLRLDESRKDITVAHRSFDNLIEKYSLYAETFTTLGGLAEKEKILEPDLGIVAGVSQLVPKSLLEVPRLGFIGMHPTLLPEGRGRAPIPWAIIKGLQSTGVTWFWCDENADTGRIVSQMKVPIYYEDTVRQLGRRTDDMAVHLLLTQCLPEIKEGVIFGTRQTEKNVTYWPKRNPEDSLIDWSWDSGSLYDWIRALTHPYPGAFTYLNGRKLYIWSARESYDTRYRFTPENLIEFGEVIDILPHGVLVNHLLLQRVQWEGEDEVNANEAGLKIRDILGE